MIMAELSDLELSYYAKEVFAQLEQDNEFNMVIDHFVYNMTYKDIAKEYNVSDTTIRNKVISRISKMKYWLSIMDTPNKARGLYYGKRAIL